MTAEGVAGDERELAMFRDMVRGFVETEISPHADEWERAGMFPAHDLFPKLGTLGLLGLSYDAEFGGQEAPPVYTAVLGEELGRIPAAGIALGIAVQTDMATPALHRFGSDDLKRDYLMPAVRGDAVAAVAITEPDAGSDVAAIQTRARRDGGDWVLNGRKMYITNGCQADWVCVLARTSTEAGPHHGMSQLIVPADSPGFAVTRKLDKLGNRSSDTAELLFDDCRVPADHLVGEEGRGFQQQMAQFQPERLIAAYMAVGQSQAALDRTISYVTARTAFGRPLSANQYIQFTLAELWAEVELLRGFVYRVAELAADGRDMTRYATVAKLKSGRLLRQVADACVQFHGGLGYMEESWTARFFRDSRLLSIGGGADEVMLRILAREMGLESGS